jgi:hypothetical protein
MPIRETKGERRPVSKTKHLDREKENVKSEICKDLVEKREWWVAQGNKYHSKQLLFFSFVLRPDPRPRPLFQRRFLGTFSAKPHALKTILLDPLPWRVPSGSGGFAASQALGLSESRVAMHRFGHRAVGAEMQALVSYACTSTLACSFLLLQ